MENILNIWPCKQTGRFKLSSSNIMFQNERLIFEVFETYMTVKTPSLDFNGLSYKTYLPNKSTKTRRVTITNERLSPGRFFISEDSTEDELIIEFE